MSEVAMMMLPSRRLGRYWVAYVQRYDGSTGIGYGRTRHRAIISARVVDGS